jgi:hypothetical protein
MTKASKKIRTSPGHIEEPIQIGDRSEEFCNREDVRDALLEIYRDIERGFDKQAERADDTIDYWDVYNCELGAKQFYSGNSKIFVPIVHSAVEARKTRFVNQMFPQSGRYVEVTTEDGDIPHAETALLEHYIRQAKIRTRVAPSIVKNGDVEGHMTIQVTWEETKRKVCYRGKKPITVEDLQAGDEEDDIIEEEITQASPCVSVIADADLLVLPQTADSLDQALADGGSVTTLCRWSRAKIKKKIALGEIDEEAGEELLEEMRNQDKSTWNRRDKGKEMVDAAGIKGEPRGKYALIYRTWTYLTIDDERYLYLCYYGGEDKILSCKRNPYWSDRIDIISAASDKIDGAFKGRSRLANGVADIQYWANDACNEGADSSAYALSPIIMTDPEKNPNIGKMVLTMAAVWETSPNDTQFAKFPPLWKDALEIVAVAKNEVFQALSVNPAQLTGATNPKKKPTQAEIANEQQIDILTTADAVITIEDEILTPMIRFMIELDHQYRDIPMKVREYGDSGMKQTMTEIDPIQMDRVYSFRWFGVEQARNAQQLQQQIGALNMLRTIPPELYPGYTPNFGPVLSQMVENLFGPRLAPLTFRNDKDELSVDPKVENQVLSQGHIMPVHLMDNHMEHIQAHTQLAQTTGDPSGVTRVHIMAHLKALEKQQQMNAGGPPGGIPGQGGGKPGGAGGGPKPGASPGQARPGGQQPPGAIHQDRLKDPRVAPRL